MKILVPITKVPDTTSKIAFTDNNTKFDKNGITFIMNPSDEWYAVVRAVELKEANPGSEVVVLHVGAADSDQIIRKALAIGADKAVRVDADPTDAYFVAAQIAAHAKEGGYDLILTGKETIDYNSFEVAGMIAEFLGLPCVTLVSKLEVSNGIATAKREIEGGAETVELPLPAVIGANEGFAVARIPNMKGIMGARSKPLSVVAAADTEKLTLVAAYTLPEKAKQVKLIDKDNVGELVRLLHEEAKVI